MNAIIIPGIESIVCQGENLPPDGLHSKNRTENVREVRQIVMYFAIENKVTTVEAGRYYNRDHATAIHAKKRIEDLCTTDSKFKARIDNYKTKVDKFVMIYNKLNVLLPQYQILLTLFSQTKTMFDNLEVQLNILSDELSKFDINGKE